MKFTAVCAQWRGIMYEKVFKYVCLSTPSVLAKRLALRWVQQVERESRKVDHVKSLAIACMSNSEQELFLSYMFCKTCDNVECLFMSEWRSVLYVNTRGLI